MTFHPGKIPVNILQEIVFKNLGAKRREVVLGPLAGIDGAVIDIGDKSIIASMDPITATAERIGWLAVNVNANDVATFGVQPAYFLSCILLPEKTDRKIIQTLCSQMNKAAKNLGIAIIGGHTEVTPDLANPKIVGCAIGITEKGNYVTAKDAEPEDKLILTKTAGIEGTAILASDKKKQLGKTLSQSETRKATSLYDQISIVKEATIAFRTGFVNAMHDPTEGGIAGGVHEMADASNTGFIIFQEKISIAHETMKICEFFQIDPLYLIASGSMLIAAQNNKARALVNALRKNGTKADIIGEFLDSPSERIIRRKNGKEEALPRPVCDHVWLALRKC